MARSQDQRRWRANTSRQRIEIYLPVKSIAALDALAAVRGASRASRAMVIADLISNTAQVADTPETDAVAAIETAEQTTTAVLEPASTATAEVDSGYRFRRPRHADEQRYQWIAEVDGGIWIALGPDPARFDRWRGMVLDGSLYIKEAKGHSRNDVVAKLLQGQSVS